MNHENKIGFKRGSPLNGGDLFAYKSKPIAKSASQRYVTKRNLLSFEFRDIRKDESFVHPRNRSASKPNQGMVIDAGFLPINAGSTLQKYCSDVRNKSWDRICWPHHGPAYGGERRAPKRVEGTSGESKSACGLDLMR